MGPMVQDGLDPLADPVSTPVGAWRELMPFHETNHASLDRVALPGINLRPTWFKVKRDPRHGQNLEVMSISVESEVDELG
jgi:hypothetical protein